jgi:hypothetical protein
MTKQLISQSLAALVALAIPLTAIAPAQARTYLGTPDMNADCIRRAKLVSMGPRFMSAYAYIAVPGNAYSWSCAGIYSRPGQSSETIGLGGFDLYQICRTQYRRPNAYAQVDAGNKPYSWKCFAP